MAAVDPGRRILGDGSTAETEWLDWLATLNPPALAIDDLLPAGTRLVVVSPHPDDEVLACGGLVAWHAQRRGETAIVAVTDGEASHRGDPEWPAERLARTRGAERRLGLARLGLGAASVTTLGLPDSQVAARIDTLEQALRAVLRPTDCVLTTWRLDGHPDHDAVGSTTVRVGADLGVRVLEAPVWMWHWSAPRDARVPWHRLRGLALPAPVRDRKAAALAAHVTQLAQRAGDAPVLGPAIVARAARHAEYFFV